MINNRRPGNLPVNLSTEEILCIVYGLDIKYKDSLSRILAVLRAGKPHPKDESFIQISSAKQWRKWFGTSTADQEAVKLVQDKMLDSQGSWQEGKFYDGYKMSEQAHVAIKSFRSMRITRDQYLEAINPELNAKAIAKKRKSIHKQLKKLETANMPSANFDEVAINIPAILIALPELDNWILHLESNGEAPRPILLGTEVDKLIEEKGKDGTFNYLVDTREALASWLEAVESSLSQRYYRIDSGRLQEQSPGLQGETSLAMTIALHGHWDYDIKACGHTIVLHRAIEHSLPCFNILNYVTNKSEIREKIAKHLNLTEGKVKQAFTAMVYGGGDGLHHAIHQILGDHAHSKFMAVPQVRKLYDELQLVFNEIVENNELTPDAKAYINRQGYTKEVEQAKKDGQLVAFYLQGDESALTDAALQAHKSAVLPKFDGWVCVEREDPVVAEKAILEATGMSVQVAQKKLLIDGLPLGQFGPLDVDDWDGWLVAAGAI